MYAAGGGAAPLPPTVMAEQSLDTHLQQQPPCRPAVPTQTRKVLRQNGLSHSPWVRSRAHFKGVRHPGGTLSSCLRAFSKMYNLRKINNMYSEHAGERSDFIILGHPEFIYGKQRAQVRGMPAGWDARGILSHPAKNMAKTRSTCALVGDLTVSEKRPPLKERALLRSASSGASPKSRSMLRDDFEGFVAALQEPELARQGQQRTLTDAAKSQGWSAVCRHFGSMDRELGELRRRLHDDPEGTRRELQRTGAWKFYADHIEQAKRLHAQFRREQKMHLVNASQTA
mmetsp:Transcript_51380/g.166572  ORF Transcript_51380/g.166572 Transcript_51380/m.166572 type:complete len:285 (-) Transcript_51380:73-927(-)